MIADGLMPILLAFAIVTISPGPANIAVAAVSMGSGRQDGLHFGAGLALGLAVWGVVAATGLGVVLQASEYALIVMKLMGGMYLLWLAYQSAASATRPDMTSFRQQKNGQWFLRGLLLNLSNPKAVVAWMAALSMGLGGDIGTAQVWLASVLCMILGLVNYLCHALVFSVPGMMDGYRRFRRWIEGCVAGLFALAGFSLLRSAFSR